MHAILDLKKVVGTDVLNDTWDTTSMTEYNKRRFVIAEGDSSKVCALCVVQCVHSSDLLAVCV